MVLSASHFTSALYVSVLNTLSVLMIFTGHIASQLGTEIRWFHVPCCNLDAMDIFRLDVESLYKAGSAAASSCKECSN
jgi:hypothetical protein